MSDRETRFKLTLQYDGSAFCGWQSQPREPTVQGEIEGALSRITGEHRIVLGSGRTDAGVHASGQVAAVNMPSTWTAQALSRSLNALLPGTIWVQDAEAVHASFNPRFDAVSRSYEYRIGTVARAASPFRRRWCWPLCRPVDLEAATRAAELLPGKHCFRSFSKSGQPKRDYECRVISARWSRWEDLGAVFEITANRFLHRMVRYLVGTMVDVALGRREEGDMALLLRAEPGQRALTTSRPAPPRGLFLAAVTYPAGGEGPARQAGSAKTTAVTGSDT